MRKKSKKPIQYDYYVHSISGDDQPAYKAIIPAFNHAIVYGDSLFSGKILVRIHPLLHEKVFLEAQSTGKSLNKYIEEQLIHD